MTDRPRAVSSPLPVLTDEESEVFTPPKPSQNKPEAPRESDGRLKRKGDPTGYAGRVNKTRRTNATNSSETSLTASRKQALTTTPPTRTRKRSKAQALSASTPSKSKLARSAKSKAKAAVLPAKMYSTRFREPLPPQSTVLVNSFKLPKFKKNKPVTDINVPPPASHENKDIDRVERSMASVMPNTEAPVQSHTGVQIRKNNSKPEPIEKSATTVLPNTEAAFQSHIGVQTRKGKSKPDIKPVEKSTTTVIPHTDAPFQSYTGVQTRKDKRKPGDVDLNKNNTGNSTQTAPLGAHGSTDPKSPQREEGQQKNNAVHAFLEDFDSRLSLNSSGIATSSRKRARDEDIVAGKPPPKKRNAAQNSSDMNTNLAAKKCLAKSSAKDSMSRTLEPATTQKKLTIRIPAQSNSHSKRPAPAAEKPLPTTSRIPQGLAFKKMATPIMPPTQAVLEPTCYQSGAPPIYYSQNRAMGGDYSTRELQSTSMPVSHQRELYPNLPIPQQYRHDINHYGPSRFHNLGPRPEGKTSGRAVTHNTHEYYSQQELYRLQSGRMHINNSIPRHLDSTPHSQTSGRALVTHNTREYHSQQELDRLQSGRMHINNSIPRHLDSTPHSQAKSPELAITYNTSEHHSRQVLHPPQRDLRPNLSVPQSWHDRNNYTPSLDNFGPRPEGKISELVFTSNNLEHHSRQAFHPPQPDKIPINHPIPSHLDEIRSHSQGKIPAPTLNSKMALSAIINPLEYHSAPSNFTLPLSRPARSQIDTPTTYSSQNRVIGGDSSTRDERSSTSMPVLHPNLSIPQYQHDRNYYNRPDHFDNFAPRPQGKSSELTRHSNITLPAGVNSLEYHSASSRPALPLPCPDLISTDDHLPSHLDEEAHEEEEMTLISESALPANFLEQPTTSSPKLPLRFNPPIWAESRQEVCESFPYFRSYQGGVYFSGGTVKGYLLSGFPSKRDIFHHDGKLIISHGGGKAESIKSTRGKNSVQAASDQQADDKSVRALITNYKEGIPCALVMDDKYSLFPYDLAARGVCYAVLGLYNVTHAWAEKHSSSNDSGYVVRYKFAFQWREDQGKPWWIPEDPAISLPVGNDSMPGSSTALPQSSSVDLQSKTDIPAVHELPVSRKCNECRMASPQVYIQAWTCLTPGCSMFWKDLTPFEKKASPLKYSPLFLRLQTIKATPSTSRSLTEAMSLIKRGGNSRDAFTTYESTRGWLCPKAGCGRLSCRSKWQNWECHSCKETLAVPTDVRKPRELRIPMKPLSLTEPDVYTSSTSGIQRKPAYVIFGEGCNIQCQTFVLPESRGFIHQIQHKALSVRTEPDEIFELYQEQANSGELPFRRWPLRNHKLRGSLLTNYFSQNCGVPYQYVGGTANTIPFSHAPKAVVKARDFMIKRIKTCIENLAETADLNFNEILSAAYMETQSMAFHSDAERGLGPLVAGLSLGSPAYMHFRAIKKTAGESRKNDISLILRHGDILVMDGLKVQEFYQHTVVPKGFRMSATARLINQ